MPPWWAAYVGEQTGSSSVIAPTPWFRTRSATPDLLPPQWELRSQVTGEPLTAVNEQVARNRVSVLIPARERPAMLKEAVESVVLQTKPASEIIIVLSDASAECTALADDLARRDGIKVVAIPAYKHFDWKHYVHAHSPHASEHDRIFEKDVLLMEEHFDRWMRPQNFSFLSIRYENLFDHETIEALSSYLNAPVVIPPWKPHEADWRSHPERDKIEATYRRLADEATYRRLADKVSTAPSVKLWHMTGSPGDDSDRSES